MRWSLLLLMTCLLPLAAARAGWNPVPAVDWSKVQLSDFADDELDLPYMLYHFAQVANAVVEDGPTRGFLDLKVNREPQDNQPYNARILENHVALAYFYCTDRPWNLYRGSPEVKVRLEAMLDFWCHSQNEKGEFAEYAADNWSLAPTGFGVMAMSRTLELLKDGPSIDADVHQRAIAAQKKGILALLRDDGMLKRGRDWSNQYTGVYTATLSYMRLYPESRDELLPLLRARMAEVMKLHQSPAGFMYEAGGPDCGYTLGTYLSSVGVAWFDAHESAITSDLVEEVSRLANWTSYSLVRQPDGSGYFADYGLNCRTATNFFRSVHTPLAERVSLMRAFDRSADEHAADLKHKREVLAEKWGQFAPLKLPSSQAYTPVPFSWKLRKDWYPSADEHAAAVAQLPYVQSSRFTTVLADDRRPLAVVFVRRPSYYAPFNVGVPKNPRQRYGLGLLWNDAMGCVMQSQSNSSDLAWGTRAGESPVYEAASVEATARVAGAQQTLPPGRSELAEGAVEFEYKLGSEGTKTVVFDDAAIDVTIKHPASFSEILPLLKHPSGQLEIKDNRITLTRNGWAMQIDFDAMAKPQQQNSELKIGGLEMSPVAITSDSGSLHYRISFTKQ